MSYDQASFEEGRRDAYVSMLWQLAGELGVEDAAVAHAEWLSEKRQIINALRSICEDFGDNDWSDSLYLPDVIEKHLARHLRSNAKE